MNFAFLQSLASVLFSKGLGSMPERFVAQERRRVASRPAPSPPVHIKFLKILAHPARFERAAFAFGGLHRSGLPMSFQYVIAYLSIRLCSVYFWSVYFI